MMAIVKNKGENMKTIPKDFTVTDNHRQYCSEKWGYPMLADVFLTDFIECFESNQKKHKNWDITYKSFIRNNSPEGRFYSADYWERSIQRAKSLQFGDRRRREPVYDPRGQQPEPKQSKQVVAAAMNKLRGLLA